MNKMFKVIWNHAAQNWVAVSELNKAKGKTKSLSLAKKGIFKFSLISSALALMNGQAMAITGSNSCSYDANTKKLVCGNSESSATGNAAIAIGSQVTANGEAAVVIGRAANAGAAYSIAIGDNTKATADNTIAMGKAAAASGKQSIAMGQDSKASGLTSIALGVETKATAWASVALGDNASSSKNYAIALGGWSKASDEDAIAIGRDSEAAGNAAIALGFSAKSKAANAIAQGNSAQATAANAIAQGTGAQATANYAIATGASSQATNNFAIAHGYSAIADGIDAIAIGQNAHASGQDSIVIGRSVSTAAQKNTVVLGALARSTHENAVVLGYGSVSKEKTKETGITINGQTYSFHGTDPNSTVSVGSEGYERQIVNVAAGNISSTSTDAINGSQLYAVVQGFNNVTSNTYFHVNDGTNGGTGNATTNLGAINEAAGAQTQYSITAGVGARTSNSGESAIAIGTNATAANQSVVIGANATNEQSHSVVIGANAKSVTNINYSQATAVGYSSTAGNDSVALGSGASATGHITDSRFSGWATAVGRLSNASGRGATAIGNGATASAIDSAAFGSFANASNRYAYSFGYGSEASGYSSISFGYNSTSSGVESVSVGNKAKVSGAKSIALGSESNASMDYSVALGFRARTDAILDPLVSTSNATVNGISYGSFAGSYATSTVSVGTTFEKRTITNVAAGRILASSTDAINGSQLYWVASNLADEIAKVKKMTWNATSAADSNGTVNNNSLAEVGNGDTVTFEAGKNITITQDGKKFTIEATGSGSTTNVTVDAGEGIQVNSTTNGNDVTYTVTAKTDGTTIKIDNGNITANTGKINEAPSSGNGAGIVTVSDADKGRLATVDNVANAINSAGWVVNTGKADDQSSFDTTQQNHSEMTVSAGKRVNFLAGKNMEVKRDGSNITYATSENVTFTTVQVGGDNGPKITNDGNNIKISDKDGNPTKITNVAPGEISATSKDAVNGSQLYAVGNNINNLNNRVNKIDKDLRAGIAGAAAIAGLPQVRGNGKSMMAVAASNYRGENAVALGYTRASDNGKVLLKLSGSTNTRGDVVSAVGLGYEW